MDGECGTQCDKWQRKAYFYVKISVLAKVNCEPTFLPFASFVNEVEMFIIFQDGGRGQQRVSNWEVDRWWRIRTGELHVRTSRPYPLGHTRPADIVFKARWKKVQAYKHYCIRKVTRVHVHESTQADQANACPLLHLRPATTLIPVIDEIGVKVRDRWSAVMACIVCLVWSEFVSLLHNCQFRVKNMPF